MSVVYYRGSKLAMLLQDALSNINCTTTIIAHISTSSEDLTETLCTMQTASRIRRLQKRTRVYSFTHSSINYGCVFSALNLDVSLVVIRNLLQAPPELEAQGPRGELIIPPD